MPFKKTAATPAFGTPAESNDITGGIGWAGLGLIQQFVERGGLLVTLGNGSTRCGDAHAGFARAGDLYSTSRRWLRMAYCTSCLDGPIDAQSVVLRWGGSDGESFVVSGQAWGEDNLIGRPAISACCGTPSSTGKPLSQKPAWRLVSWFCMSLNAARWMEAGKTVPRLVTVNDPRLTAIYAPSSMVEGHAATNP